jgi:hypothetical protein
MLPSCVALAACSAAVLALSANASLGQSSGQTAAQLWTQGAPFPDASEEVLGATAAGKLYLFCGLAPG